MEKQNGVTILELMVAVSVLAILTTIAVPSYSYMMTSNLMTTQTNQLLTTLLFARSEAAKRGMSVMVCKSNSDQSACSNDNSRTGWEQGWIVYIDADNDTQFDKASNDIRLRTGSGLDSNTLTASVSTMANNIRYLPDGRSNTNGNFTFCDSTNNNDYTRQLQISPTGRPAVIKTSSGCG